MAAKHFPFITFDQLAKPRPLVPFDFPKGKNVFCLVDSGASISLMSEGFRHHEEIEYKQRYSHEFAEGICGDNCLQLLGLSKPIPISIPGLSKAAEIQFVVVPDKFKISTPIFGIDLFKHFSVTFSVDSGSLLTRVEE